MLLLWHINSNKVSTKRTNWWKGAEIVQYDSRSAR